MRAKIKLHPLPMAQSTRFALLAERLTTSELDDVPLEYGYSILDVSSIRNEVFNPRGLNALKKRGGPSG